VGKPLKTVDDSKRPSLTRLKPGENERKANQLNLNGFSHDPTLTLVFHVGGGILRDLSAEVTLNNSQRQINSGFGLRGYFAGSSTG
jgi:hypothetical protein